MEKKSERQTHIAKSLQEFQQRGIVQHSTISSMPRVWSVQGNNETCMNNVKCTQTHT